MQIKEAEKQWNEGVRQAKTPFEDCTLDKHTQDFEPNNRAIGPEGINSAPEK